MATTTKYALRYPIGSNAADVPTDMNHLASDVDAVMVGYAQGTFASRPAAGTAGRVYYATDTKAYYHDDGSAWQIIGSNSLIGVLASRPAGNAVPVGTHYFASDQIAEYVSDGTTTWIRTSEPAGAVVICLAASADAGYILLQGQSWPGTTGIYADLYARLGSPGTVPDFGTFVPVGYKSGDGSFGTLLGTLGEKVHTLSITEMPAHDHGGVTGGPNHPVDTQDSGSTGVPFGSGSGSDSLSTTHTHTIPSQGSGGTHNNIQPSKAVNYQAKL